LLLVEVGVEQVLLETMVVEVGPVDLGLELDLR
jgi:hypothetical protein